MYGRSDKRYCSSTCRRDACRVRTRTIRIRDLELHGSERSQSSSVEDYLIPKLQRDHGPYHRIIQQARRLAEKHRDAEYEEVRRAMRAFGTWLEEELPPERRGAP
jgi:hypothetical protein